MRISERQLRGIINEEIRNRSLLNEQTDPSTAAAQAKNIAKAGNVITWNDNEYDYKADVGTGAMFTAKRGQPLKPVAAGTKAHTAIKAVAAQLSAAPTAGATGPTPAPGSAACTLPRYQAPLTQHLTTNLAGVGVAATYIAFMVDLILFGKMKGVTADLLASAASKIRTFGSGDGVMGTIAAVGRTLSSMTSLGLSEAMNAFISNFLNASSVAMKTIVAAQVKFTRTCNIRGFATDIGNAFTRYLESFANVGKEVVMSYITALQRTGQAIAAAIGLTLDFLINILSFAAALVAVPIRALVAGVSAALVQAGNDLTAISGAMRESRRASGRAMRESAEAQAARTRRIMKKLSLEMYQVSRANQLLSEMDEENRRLLIRSFI